MSDVKYTKDHEWVRVEGDNAVIGITDYAQEQLGDVVFVDLADVGKKLAKGEEAAVVESVKAAAEVYAPLDGEVLEVNEALGDEPVEAVQSGDWASIGLAETAFCWTTSAAM